MYKMYHTSSYILGTQVRGRTTQILMIMDNERGHRRVIVYTEMVPDCL